MRRYGGWTAILMGLAALFVFAPVSNAHAARGKRAVPDLRRDATRWVSPRARARIRLPITIHLATDDHGPVARRHTVRRWIARANEELASAGIEVEVKAVRYLPEGWSEVTRWKQRRRLANYAPRDGTIHVFVIEELDRRGNLSRRRIRGLHWRYRGLNRKLTQREYVVVTREAPNTTLAHELGHLFGLRHTKRLDNIMCSCRSGPTIRFTTSQCLSMRSGARSFSARQARSSRTAADRRRR